MFYFIQLQFCKMGNHFAWQATLQYISYERHVCTSVPVSSLQASFHPNKWHTTHPLEGLLHLRVALWSQKIFRYKFLCFISKYFWHRTSFSLGSSWLFLELKRCNLTSFKSTLAFLKKALRLLSTQESTVWGKLCSKYRDSHFQAPFLSKLSFWNYIGSRFEGF